MKKKVMNQSRSLISNQRKKSIKTDEIWPLTLVEEETQVSKHLDALQTSTCNTGYFHLVGNGATNCCKTSDTKEDVCGRHQRATG